MVANSDRDLLERVKRGDSLAKNELVRKYMPVIRQRLKVYSRAPVPIGALEGEGIKLLLYAAQRYDPNSGVQFRTFLGHNLKGLYRYVNQHKNVARIPEHQVLQITRFKNTKDLLQVDKGREVTNEEMADALNWSVPQVRKMEMSVSRRDIAMSGIETLHEVDRLDERMEDLLEFAYFQMTPEEKLVYDYSLGRHGKMRLKDAKEISRKTGLTLDKVYEIKREVAQRVQSRL
jgi:DNA-directed RNA polymerase sigma subunit (sigma70/sigma32)